MIVDIAIAMTMIVIEAQFTKLFSIALFAHCSIL